ncbi:uncharacterized protein LOC130770810 isoform X3 [Actinidia eriantha]|nr:uncharacterized protein LOC130770810 isoform X3 [Actinidia eriantha]
MIEFDQTPDVHFFLCRECRTHIALTQELLFTEAMHDEAIFRNTVNVEVEEHHRTVGIYMVADARCNRCMELLGLKFVLVPGDHNVFRAGRFLIYL